MQYQIPHLRLVHSGVREQTTESLTSKVRPFLSVVKAYQQPVRNVQREELALDQLNKSGVDNILTKLVSRVMLF